VSLSALAAVLPSITYFHARRSVFGLDDRTKL